MRYHSAVRSGIRHVDRLGIGVTTRTGTGLSDVDDIGTRYRSYLACLNERRFGDLEEFVHDPVVQLGVQV